MKTPLSSEIETWIPIGYAIEIYQRVVYPVARISALKRCRDLLGCWIEPIAILITEPDNAYTISLTKEEIELDQLLAMAPSLNEIVGGAHGALRKDLTFINTVLARLCLLDASSYPGRIHTIRFMLLCNDAVGLANKVHSSIVLESHRFRM